MYDLLFMFKKTHNTTMIQFKTEKEIANFEALYKIRLTQGV